MYGYKGVLQVQKDVGCRCIGVLPPAGGLREEVENEVEEARAETSEMSNSNSDPSTLHTLLCTTDNPRRGILHAVRRLCRWFGRT
jgi:hypothetical protein